MKKIVCCAIIVASLFLVSCGDAPVVYSTPTATVVTAGTPPASTAETATSVATTATASQGGMTPAEVFVPKGYAPITSNVLETRSKVLLFDIFSASTQESVVFYYSKADSEFYPFCFDPFCSHKTVIKNDLIAIKCVGNALFFQYQRPNDSKHLFINSRVYFIFYDSIYSCSEFATDLRLEYSFNEMNEVTSFDYLKGGNGGKYPICDFESDGSNIFFKHVDEKGAVIQYRYDTVSRKLIDMNDIIKKAEEKVGATLYARKYINGKVYFEGYTNIVKNDKSHPYKNITGDFVGYFELNNKSGEIKKIDYGFPNNPIFTTSNGFIFYYFTEEKFSVEFIDFDGNKSVLIEDAGETLGNGPQLQYYLENSFYFFSSERVFLGKDSRGQNMYNWSGGKLFRYDINTGELKKVFENEMLDGFSIYYIDEKVAIFKAQQIIYKSDGTIDITGSILFKCHIDANGNFVDLEKVELE